MSNSEFFHIGLYVGLGFFTAKAIWSAILTFLKTVLKVLSR